jgi:hypothetical protein
VPHSWEISPRNQNAGSWPKDAAGKKKTRRVLPEGEPVDEAELATMLEITEIAIGMAENLITEIEATLAASPRKPR